MNDNIFVYLLFPSLECKLDNGQECIIQIQKRKKKNLTVLGTLQILVSLEFSQKSDALQVHEGEGSPTDNEVHLGHKTSNC